MFNETQTREIVGSTAYDSNGDKIGKVGQLFLDDQTGRPEFVTVNTGLFGMKESFVPVGEASLTGGELRLPYPKDKIKDAPSVDVEKGDHLSESDEDRLYAHYGLGAGTTTGQGNTGHDTSGPETDSAMTRSEEHLDVGTTEREAGRARLRKYVTTETETHTVPVAKEHAVVEREPVTSGNLDQALDGPEISEEEHEVVLHEEKPVVQKTTEAKERIRLGTETEVDQQTVTDEVRKEHVEVEGDVDDRRS